MNRLVDGRLALPVFAAWSLLVWGTRVNNILADADLTTGGKVGRVLLALSFVAVGVAVGAVWLRARGRDLNAGEVRVVQVSAAWTVGVWIVRSIGISLADHDGAFIAVHLVLAVVSIGLGLLAARAGTLAAHGPARDRPAEADAPS